MENKNLLTCETNESSIEMEDDNEEIMQLIRKRLELGKARYGHGVIVDKDTRTFDTKSDSWVEMHLEEILDGMIYLCAATIRLKRQMKGSDYNLETADHPMCRETFRQLSQVSGFNNTNGATYAEYCARWWTARCRGLGDDSDVADETDVVTSTSLGTSPTHYHHHLIIFDWDDTLLASSWLTSQGFQLYKPLPGSNEALHQLEDAVVKLLSQALTLGTVIIITNSELSWVELSAQNFMPRVLPFLAKARVISARSMFEGEYPDQPNEWKIQAFKHAIRDATAEVIRASPTPVGQLYDVISIGDSDCERNALRCVAGALPDTYSKSIKFVDAPPIELLTNQVKLLSSCIDNICSHSGDLDLMLSCKLQLLTDKKVTKDESTLVT